MMGRLSMSVLLWYYAGASNSVFLGFEFGLDRGRRWETGMALGSIGGVSTMNQTKIVVEV